MPKFRIFHETRYEYAQPVVLGEHRLLIRPRDGHDARIESSHLDIEPAASVKWLRDEHDNSVAVATFGDAPTSNLAIVSDVTVIQYATERHDIPPDYTADPLPFSYEEQETQALSPWMQRRGEGKRFDHWLKDIRARGNNTVELLNLISNDIYSGCEYAMREEPGVQSPDETLSKAKGSCRDYAWLFVTAARASGVAARFVSGYLHTSARHLDAHTHAWAEAFLPGAGWVGYDPTCNTMAVGEHIPVAVARYPEDIPPVSGSFSGPAGNATTMDVKVKVTLIE